MTAATSRPPSAGAERANGTIAIGIGSVTPEVISILSCACAVKAAYKLKIRKAQPRMAGGKIRCATVMALIDRFKLNFKIALEERRIRWRWQGRGAKCGRLDRLAHGCIAVTFS